MESFKITETQLRDVARFLSRRWRYDKDCKWEYNARGYIMISFGNYLEHHFRFDLVDFDGPRRAKQQLIDDKYNYLLTSVHVKGEASYDRREYCYLYLNYVAMGVWQPVWGYFKQEGRVTRRLDLTAGELATAYVDARALMEELSAATRVDHAIAAGPVLGAGASARDAGLQGMEW